MPKEPITIATVQFHADQLCLNFVNTVDCWFGPERREYLTCFRDLIVWGRRIGRLSDRQAEILARSAEDRPEEANLVYARAIELRNGLYRLFKAVGDGRPPDEADVALLDRFIPSALGRRRLEPEAGGFKLVPLTDGDRLDSLLDPVVASAVDVLTSDQLDRIKSCPAPDCGWLFLDSSRNRSRRWCDMADCGNRAKANRFYRRKKEAQAAPDSQRRDA